MAVRQTWPTSCSVPICTASAVSQTCPTSCSVPVSTASAVRHISELPALLGPRLYRFRCRTDLDLQLSSLSSATICMPITVPAVRETLASWFTRLLVCTVSAVRKVWLHGLRNYRFVQFQPSEELQFLVLFNSVRTVSAFRQTLISCFLGLCNSPFLLSQMSENFAFLGYATTHLYNFSCQSTLRALCLCSFVGLSHPF